MVTNTAYTYPSVSCLREELRSAFSVGNYLDCFEYTLVFSETLFSTSIFLLNNIFLCQYLITLFLSWQAKNTSKFYPADLCNMGQVQRVPARFILDPWHVCQIQEQHQLGWHRKVAGSYVSPWKEIKECQAVQTFVFVTIASRWTLACTLLAWMTSFFTSVCGKQLAASANTNVSPEE